MTNLVKRLRLTPLYEGSGEESGLPDEAADLIDKLISENRLLVANYGARGNLLAESREQFDAHVAWASDQVAMIEAQVDALGEALYLMSGPLRASGFLDNDANHRLYENVVAAFRELVGEMTKPLPNHPREDV